MLSQVFKSCCHSLRTLSRSNKQHVQTHSHSEYILVLCIAILSPSEGAAGAVWSISRQHTILYQKCFGGEHHFQTCINYAVLENNIKNSSVLKIFSHMILGVGVFRSQLSHLETHHFNVIGVNFPSCLISSSKYLHGQEILYVLLTTEMNKKTLTRVH